MPKQIPGIRRTPTGWRAYVRVGGQGYWKRFKKHVSLERVKRWRAEVLTAEEAAQDTWREPTFAEDVARYLEAIRAMPTYDWREKDLQHWIDAFGRDRARSTIASSDIRAVLQRWRMTGKDGKPLSESSCNHRRTALMHLWHVLDGKAAPNPVRDVPRFREPDPQPRGVPFAILQKVIAAMPPSKTRARVMVMATTGLPHATLMRLTEGDLDLRARALTVPRRRKGAGTKTRVLPLSDDAVAAFKELRTWDAWGPFSRDSLKRSLQRACVAAGVPLMRGYDLRHSFGTEAYKRSGDIRAVQALLDHSDAKLTERYTLAAVDGRMRAALDALPAVARKLPRAKRRR